MSDPVSLDEMMGQVSPPGPKGRLTLTPDQMMGPVPSPPDQGALLKFVKHAGKTFMESEKAGVEHPIDFSKGVAKGLGGGAVSLGSLAAQGIAGLATAAVGNGFGTGKEATEKFVEHIKKVTEATTGINMAPANKAEEAFTNLLGLIPEAVQAAGDSVYDKTGSALAGSGTQGFLTLLTLKPGLAAKPFEGLRKASAPMEGDISLSPAAAAGADKVRAAYTDLAVKDPDAAEALWVHIKTADPKTAKVLEDQSKKAVTLSKEGQIKNGEDYADARMREQRLLNAQRVLSDDRPIIPARFRREEPKLIEGRDSTSSPQTLYRGTPKGIDPNAPSNIGTFLTPHESVAKTYAGPGGQVTRHSADFRNLLSSSNWMEAKEKLGLPRSATMQDLVSRAGEKGYDGLSFQTTNGKEFVRVPIPKGKKFLPAATPSQIGSAVRKAVSETYETLAGKDLTTIGKEDPTVYYDKGEPVTKGQVDGAFKSGIDLSFLGTAALEGKLREYGEQMIQTFNPEALGPEAKVSASVLAKNVSRQVHEDSMYFQRSEERRTFWNVRAKDSLDFIRDYERGKGFSDPALDRAAQSYRNWNQKIFESDKKMGFEYEPVDNYLYHLFEEGDKVAEFMSKKYGRKWNDPSFIKDRTFDFYDQALKAGFKPKYTNPEDIMLARQHASTAAGMKVQTLRDLARWGVAKKIGPGVDLPDYPSTEWRSPNGDRYAVHNHANAVLHNFFNTKSLWTAKGVGGDAFRGAMWLKNVMVPIKLAVSLFHPIHVQTIDNATGMVRASKELLSGTKSPLSWMKDMLNAARYKGIWDNPKTGYRVVKAFQGKVREGDLTAEDSQALQYIFEGGFIPTMSEQYRNNSVRLFKDALQKRSAAAVFHLPFAALQATQGIMFEKWIPALKTASYLKDVKTAVTVDPTLVGNPLKRQLAFRKISKSIDNRYGEMAYNTMFWTKWVKDLAVLNTLSLGWQMGFLREYGGGVLDIEKLATEEGEVKGKARSGLFDRPLFVGFYTAQALAYGGLMTWAMTGKSPQDLLDYIYPQTGEAGKDGKPKRSNTMFYTREFAATYKHMQEQGVVEGLGRLAASKSSGVVGLAAEWASGVNSWGQEIRDPEAPAFKQLEQTLAATWKDFEPISIASIQDDPSESPLKSAALKIAGFSPAPKYVTQDPIEAEISNTYQKYYAPKQTPFEKAQYSNDARQAKKAFESNDDKTYTDILDRMTEKYELTADESRKLERSISKSSGEDTSVKMFTRLDWHLQKSLLDKMPAEMREKYLPHSNKHHLRRNYIPPEGT